MFEKLTNLLNSANSGAKEFVGISLNMSGLLEVTSVNRGGNGSIVKYTNRHIAYNPITREIDNYDNFRDELSSALDELQLNPKDCNATISMPNVMFGISSLPDMLTEDEITSAVTSTVEESFLFKQAEPLVSWQQLRDDEDDDDADDSMKKIVYCAIQESAIKELRRVFTELGISLISIQNSFSTMFAGLNFSGVLKKVTKGEKTPLNVLLISSASYSIFNFKNDVLANYVEEPLAVKAFGEEEVYSAVSLMAAVTLQNHPTDNLLVISETDEVSAEVISTKLGFDGIPYYIEQNKYQQSPPIDVDLNVLPGFVPQITLTAIGAAVDYFESKYFKFNYLVTRDGTSTFEERDLITIGNKTITLTRELAIKYTAILCGAILLVSGFFYFILNRTVKGAEDKLDALKAEEAKLQEEYNRSQNEQPTVNIGTTIDAIVAANRKKMLYYDALSYGIPEKVWVEHFYAGPGNAISINGVAVDSSDIALFLRGIRNVAGESNVSVKKLEITGEDTGNELYTFELTSNSYNGEAAQPAQADQAQNAQQNQPQQNQPEAANNIPPANEPSSAPPVIPSE